MPESTLKRVEIAWAWASRIMPVVLLIAGLYLSATYASKASVSAEVDRLDQADRALNLRVDRHDVNSATVANELRHVNATLARLEAQNTAILERLPARVGK